MRISDGSSDVCSSDLRRPRARGERDRRRWPPAVAVVADPGADEPADGAAVAAADDDQLYPHHHRTVDPAPRAGAAADAAEQGARGPQPLPFAEIGRASCRGSRCQSVSFSVWAVYVKQTNNYT